MIWQSVVASSEEDQAGYCRHDLSIRRRRQSGRHRCQGRASARGGAPWLRRQGACTAHTAALPWVATEGVWAEAELPPGQKWPCLALTSLRLQSAQDGLTGLRWAALRTGRSHS